MPTPAFDFEHILSVLCAHRVEYIVIGGVCGVLHGAPINTFDLDVVHSRTAPNLERLLAALHELDAYYREQPDRRLRPSLSHLASPGHQLLMTCAGPLDLLGTISQERSYEDLFGQTTAVQLRDDLSVRLLNLAVLITVKEETGRPKDRAVLDVLRDTLAEREKDKG